MPRRRAQPPAAIERVGIYCRVSTEDQADGVSLEIQRAACRAYAAERGWTVVAEWQDVMSGLVETRPGYQEAMQRYAEYHALLVWRFDRLGRDTKTLVVAVADLARHGCELLSATEDNTSLLGRDLAFILAAEESRRIRARVSPAMHAMARDGYWISSKPFGYRFAPDPERPGRRRLVIDEEEAAIYRQAVTWRLDGLSTRKIATRVNQLVVPGFPLTSLVRILRSPVQAGWVCWHDERYPGRHEPLIDQERWEALQRSLGDSRAARSNRGEHMLRSLVWCGACKRRMTMHRTYYRCHNGQVGRCPMRAMVRQDVAERYVDEQVIGRLVVGSIDWWARVERYQASVPDGEAALIADRQRLERDIATQERRLVQLRRRLVDETITTDEYHTDRATYQAALDAARAELATLPATTRVPRADLDQMVDGVNRWLHLWPHMTATERRAILLTCGLALSWDGKHLSHTVLPAIAVLLA